MHALNRSWLDDPDGLTVTMDGGKVRLTGSVRSPRDRDLAACIAWAGSLSRTTSGSFDSRDGRPRHETMMSKLEALEMTYPKSSDERRQELLSIRRQLEA